MTSLFIIIINGEHTLGGVSLHSPASSSQGGFSEQAPMQSPFPSQTALGMIGQLFPATSFPLVSSTQSCLFQKEPCERDRRLGGVPRVLCNH